jgi:hypothetical protein
MAGSPLYFSETFTVGPRTYLMEVRRTNRGQKYFIITRTDVMDDQQQPVIIFDGHMNRFAEAINRATQAVAGLVGEVEPADQRISQTRQKATKRKKAQPRRKIGVQTPKASDQSKAESAEAKRKAAERKKERPNQGRRWTEEHDSLLIVHYKNGMPTEELAKLLGRGEFSIGVRLAKLGLAQLK